jgi:hypothetical protein
MCMDQNALEWATAWMEHKRKYYAQAYRVIKGHSTRWP